MASARTLFVFKGHWAGSISIWKVLQTGLKSFLEDSFENIISPPKLNQLYQMNKQTSNHLRHNTYYQLYFSHLWTFGLYHNAWLNHSHKNKYRCQNSNFHFKTQNCSFMILNFYPNLYQYKNLNLWVWNLQVWLYFINIKQTFGTVNTINDDH